MFRVRASDVPGGRGRAVLYKLDPSSALRCIVVIDEIVVVYS